MKKKVKYYLIMSLVVTLGIIAGNQGFAISEITVSGTVTDTYEEVIDGALVELKIYGNGRVVDTDSTEDGEYQVSAYALPGVEFSVTISKATWVSESAAGYYVGTYTNENFTLHHVPSITGTDWARTLHTDVEQMVDDLVQESDPEDYELAEYIYYGIVTNWNHYSNPPIIDDCFEKDTTIIEEPFYYSSTGKYWGLCYHAAVISSAYCRAFSSSGLPNGISTRMIWYESESGIYDHYSTEVLIEWEGSTQWVPLDVESAYNWYGRSEEAKDNISNEFYGCSIEHLSIIWIINGKNEIISDRMDVVDPAQYAWYKEFLTDLL